MPALICQYDIVSSSQRGDLIEKNQAAMDPNKASTTAVLLRSNERVETPETFSWEKGSVVGASFDMVAFGPKVRYAKASPSLRSDITRESVRHPRNGSQRSVFLSSNHETGGNRRKPRH